MGAKVKPFVPAPGRHDPGSGLDCDVQDGVTILRGPTGVRYPRPLRLNGAFALKVARFKTLAQKEAQAVFGRKLVRIEHFGTYVCRTVAGASVPSQHATGNAIDVHAFVLAGGRRIVVQRDFVRGGVEASTPAGKYLQRLLEQARRERLFGTVLTPDFDRHHDNHLHLDGRSWGSSWWRRLLG
ncbi:MAG TPA: extensin family protein [Polyangia bacterium]